jgi:hypothetical protein
MQVFSQRDTGKRARTYTSSRTDARRKGAIVSVGPGRNVNGGILVRFETCDGMVRWRNVPNLDHKTLCTASGLAEGHVTFDVAESFRADGRSQAGRRDGIILWNDEPIGFIVLASPGEKFPDINPLEMMRKIGCKVSDPAPDPWKDKGHVAPPGWGK